MTNRRLYCTYNTFNADPTLRKEAEANLKHYFTMPDALSSLICFTGNHEIHRDLGQAAAIAIKNNSRDFYRTDERAIAVPYEERNSEANAFGYNFIRNRQFSKRTSCRGGEEYL